MATRTVTTFGILVVCTILASCQEQDCNGDRGYHKVGGTVYNPRCEAATDASTSAVGEGSPDAAGSLSDGQCPPMGTCDPCVENAQCPASDPVCSDHACKGCSEASDCSVRTATPACDAKSGACVECTATDSSKCTLTNQVCRAGATECVQCNENADCKGATKPICGGDNACHGCRFDSECQDASPFCVEETGECVACEPNKDDPSLENCANGNACDPTTFTCTGALRRTLSTCDQCLTDSECTDGTKCVSTTFSGSPHGHYCLLIAADSPTLCPNQYAARRTANSVLGVNDEYCFPNDTFTTCEAVVAFKAACAVDADCGAGGLDDGLCKDNVCTYGCDGARDCSGSTSMANKCIGGAQKFCDPN